MQEFRNALLCNTHPLQTLHIGTNQRLSLLAQVVLNLCRCGFENENRFDSVHEAWKWAGLQNTEFRATESGSAVSNTAVLPFVIHPKNLLFQVHHRPMSLSR